MKSTRETRRQTDAISTATGKKIRRTPSSTPELRYQAFIVFLILFGVTGLPAATAAGGGIPLSPAFTYQGELRLAGLPATGPFDFVFEVSNAATGIQIGPTLTLEDVVVEDGIFSVVLDFGPIFAGLELDLEIAVREGASTGAFTTLQPRQRVTSSPNALYASTGEWSGLLGVPSGFADNTDDDVLGGLSCIEDGLAVQGAGGVWRCGGIVRILGTAGSTMLEVSNVNTSGTAIYGLAGSSAGTTYGVRGVTVSPDGFGGHFVGARHHFNGPLGLGTQSPLAALHVQDQDLGLDPAEVTAASDNLVVEALDAAVSLYSTADSSYGSRLSFGEVDGAGSLVDKWSLVRLTSGATSGPDLRFTYGADPSAANNSTTMVLGSNGRVGIGTTSPGFLLHVDGDAGKPGGGSWTSASDRRLKKNIEDLEGALDSLARLRGVTFEYIDPEAIHELPGGRIGMIAQEVEKVFPDWVSTGSDGYKRVTIRGFEALAVEAFKELRAENERLESRIANLELLLLSLQPRNAAEATP